MKKNREEKTEMGFGEAFKATFGGPRKDDAKDKEPKKDKSKKDKPDKGSKKDKSKKDESDKDKKSKKKEESKKGKEPEKEELKKDGSKKKDENKPEPDKDKESKKGKSDRKDDSKKESGAQSTEMIEANLPLFIEYIQEHPEYRERLFKSEAALKPRTVIVYFDELGDPAHKTKLLKKDMAAKLGKKWESSGWEDRYSAIEYIADSSGRPIKEYKDNSSGSKGAKKASPSSKGASQKTGTEDS